MNTDLQDTAKHSKRFLTATKKIRVNPCKSVSHSTSPITTHYTPQLQMRLTKEQIRIIAKVVSRIAGEKAEVFLFGSRVNDQAKGGDVDMLIEVNQRLSRLDRGRIKMELEQALGLPVDILVHVRDTELTPFQTIAYAHATRLAVRP